MNFVVLKRVNYRPICTSLNVLSNEITAGLSLILDPETHLQLGP